MSGLDGLRALAVLAVIAYHLNFGWAQGGLLGVGVFFVLSGYLITDLLLSQRERTGRIWLGRFWLRRARRLLPALWVMLAVVAVWVSLVQPEQLAALRQDVVAAFAYASNWWYVFQHVSYFASFGPPSPLGHLWSLAVEEQFYVVWPLLLILAVRFVRRRQVLVVLVLLGVVASALAMAALYQAGGNPNRMYYGTDTRAFELLIGASLALVWPSRRVVAAISRRRRAALDAVGVSGLAVIALMVVYTNQYQPFVYQGGLVLLSLAAAALVVALTHPLTVLSKVMGAPPMRWLGARSYGIYLWHYPIIILTTPLVDSAGPHLVRSAAQVTATVVLAALSWRYVEEPIRHGALAAWIARVRAVRWPVVGLAGFSEAVAVALLAAVVTGAEVAGVAPAPKAVQTVPRPAVSVSLPSEEFSPPPATPCVSVATTPAPSPSSAPAAAATPAAQPESPAPPAQVTAVGDSIMIDVAPFLRALLPGVNVDGKVSRQMYQLPPVVTALRTANKLSHRLVIELGTDGPFSGDQLISVLRSLGPMDRIVLVNTRVPRSWQNAVNQTLMQVASQVPQATVVDWYTASAGMPQYFWSDGVHPDSQGSRVLATLIAHAVDPAPAASTPTPTPMPSPAEVHPFRCG